MAIINAPLGFQPVSHTSGQVRAIRMPNGIASAYGTAIYKFQPIKLVAGLIQPIASGTDPVFGVMAGVEFTPVGGRPTVSPFWPAGQAYDNTNDMNVYFWPAWDESMRFAVQADGSVAQALMGGQFNTSNITAGSIGSGLSGASVAAAGVGTGVQGQWTLFEFGLGVNDQYGGGDTFTNLIVFAARNQVGGAVAVSI